LTNHWEAQIIQHLGEAVDIIPTLDMKFDLVFIDADKKYLIILISFFQNEQRRDYPF
jgi:predicted O-methyltransferase YrrM